MATETARDALGDAPADASGSAAKDAAKDAAGGAPQDDRSRAKGTAVGPRGLPWARVDHSSGKGDVAMFCLDDKCN